MSSPLSTVLIGTGDAHLWHWMEKISAFFSFWIELLSISGFHLKPRKSISLLLLKPDCSFIWTRTTEMRLGEKGEVMGFSWFPEYRILLCPNVPFLFPEQSIIAWWYEKKLQYFIKDSQTMGTYQVSCRFQKEFSGCQNKCLTSLCPGRRACWALPQREGGSLHSTRIFVDSLSPSAKFWREMICRTVPCSGNCQEKHKDSIL